MKRLGSAGRAFVVSLLATLLLAGIATPQLTANEIPRTTLRVAHQFPPTGLVSEMDKWFFEEITRRTDGRVQFNVFWSESLLRTTDIIDGVRGGIADIGLLSSTYDPTRTPLFMVLDGPYNFGDPGETFKPEDYYCAVRAPIDVFNQSPHLRAEFERNGLRLLRGYSSGYTQFVSPTPVAQLSDLRGRRHRTYGGAWTRMWQELGTDPVFMSILEVYEQIDRGVLDGASEVAPTFIESLRVYEVAPHILRLDSGMVVASTLVINLDRWNSFPRALQQVFEEVRDELHVRFAHHMAAGENRIFSTLREKHGVTIHRLSDEERAFLREKGRQAHEAFVQEIARQHRVPAMGVLQTFRNVLQACELEGAQKGYPWERGSSVN